MKKIITLIAFSTFCLAAFAQETADQIMEKRAREFHRVIGLNDKEQWRKFIKENYSEALINKPMKQKLTNQDNSGSTTEKKNLPGQLEEKVKMFERLHNDFGNSKIESIKKTNENLKMEVSGSGTEGVFNFKFGTSKPYLIEGLGIELNRG